MKHCSTTFVRVLAISGAAFLIATGDTLIRGPINLGPTSLTSGTDGVKGDASRVKRDAREDATQEQPEQPDVAGAGGSDIDTTPGVDPLDAPVPEGMLTLREAHELWELGAYFIDSRHDYEYEEAHIQYASWLVSAHFDTEIDRVLEVTGAIPPDGTIVLYCVGGECDASKNTAARLEEMGYTDLRIMGAGFSDWARAGLPVGSGMSP